MTVCQKLGVILESKVVLKLIDFWNQKLTLKVQFWHFLMNRNSLKKNPLSMLILGQKPCFLGPTIFEIPRPN